MLVDTSFLVDLLRGRKEATAMIARLENDGTPIQIPSVAVFELYRGVALSRLPDAEKARIKAVVSSRSVLPLDKEAAEMGGLIDGGLKKEGKAIDPEDAMIAGIALAQGQRVVTSNHKHFQRVPGLRVEPMD